MSDAMYSTNSHTLNEICEIIIMQKRSTNIFICRPSDGNNAKLIKDDRLGVRKTDQKHFILQEKLLIVNQRRQTVSAVNRTSLVVTGRLKYIFITSAVKSLTLMLISSQGLRMNIYEAFTS